jgi:two-component system chemotaxis sensor kinase CheA
VDLAKYRALFLEEATEHLAEMSRALLDLEKDPATGEAIELVFRMAHSIKSMAASLEYSAIADLSHRLEDRMEVVRSAGRVDGAEDLGLLFRGLEGLERMVGIVRDTGEPPAGDPELLSALTGLGSSVEDPPAKKVTS